MRALIGTYQRAVNRLLPYGALELDLVADEQYYTFNDSSATDPEDDLSQWTQGSNALTTDGSATHTYNGEASWVLRADSTPPIDDNNVYVESAATNLHTDIPCTFRVIARAGVLDDVWIRIYDPNQALSDAWFHLTAGSTGDPETHLGEVGQTAINVIEARITYPIPDLTNLGPGSEGDSAHFMLIEMELPAAASRTMRIQVVDGDADSDLDAQSVVYIARAEIRQGKVSRWTCRRTGRTFSQATPANQPYARPMGVPQFNGRRVLRFDGGQWLVSDDAASEWDFLHSGVGCSVYAAFLGDDAQDGYICGTAGNTEEGFRLNFNGTNDTVNWCVNNASGTIFSRTTTNGTTPADTLYVASYRVEDGHADGDCVMSVGGESFVANSASWSTSGAPFDTLHIGVRGGAVGGFDGYIADIAIYDDRLTDDEHARVVEELEALNASSGSIPGCICWVRAGEQVDEPLTTWGDLSGNGNNITGALGNFPELIDSSPSFRGSPSVLYEEADRSLGDAAASEIADLAADHAVIMTCQVTALTAGIDIIWVFQNSGDIEQYELFGVSSGAQWRYERGADGGGLDLVDVGTADAKPHVHSFVLASGERSSYVDGSPLFEGVASTPGTMGTDQLTIGANRAGSLGSSLSVSEIAVYDTAPTTYQRQLVERAQRRRMLGMMSLKLGFSLGQNTPAPSASLLSVAQSVGAVLLFDMYTPSAYATSGANVVSVTNRISGVVHPWGGINPPVFSATGLNGGPCWEGDGTDDRQFVGTEAAVLALLANNTPHEVFAVCSFDVADANGYIFGANGTTSFLTYGQASTGAGRWRMRIVNDDASVDITSDTTLAYPADTNPHMFNYRRSNVASLYVDQVVTSIDNTPQDATAGGTASMTFDTYRWGHYQSAAAGEIDGKASLLVITPALDESQRNALVAAMKAHHPALGSLIS